MKSYISAKEIQELVPIPICQARKLVNEIQDEMENQGYRVFKTKTKLVPTKLVLRKLGLKKGDIKNDKGSN